MIAVAIRDVRLIFFFINEDLGGPAQVLHIVAAFALARLTDLHEKFSGLRELQDHRVVRVTQRTTGLLLILFLTCTCGGSLAPSSLAPRSGGSLSAPAGCGTAGRCADAVSTDPHVAFVVNGDAVI